MKLPDFLEFAPFNKMRSEMNANRLGSFELFDYRKHLTGIERSELEQTGVSVPVDQLWYLPDNTLAYKNSRVLLYMVEERYYQQHNILPFYHIAYCNNVRKIIENGEDPLINVSTNQSSVYPLLENTKEKNTALKKMSVCKDCLQSLNYQGFDGVRNRKREYSQRIYMEFSLADFVDLYPIYPVTQDQTHVYLTGV